jgi:hypothetical protein
MNEKRRTWTDVITCNIYSLHNEDNRKLYYFIYIQKPLHKTVVYIRINVRWTEEYPVVKLIVNEKMGMAVLF